MRLLWAVAGGVFSALGAVGVAVPLLPTVPFLLLALACFARSSPRLEAWLLGHPRLGPPLQSWREHGAIAPRAKVVAVVALSISLAIFLRQATAPRGVQVGVSLIALGVAVFLVTRPSGPSAAGEREGEG